ncbi:hypothetical protein ABE096_03195 [Robertmurraya massiliosenegalensis]|uniref:hypothetical protein n=1 Tax=Robertmurraya TaxID=2837507 RepID=UPI0039A68709
MFASFLQWTEGSLPYYELTEHIHIFHQINQKIWTKFNYDDGWNDELLIFQAKKELDLLIDEEKEDYKHCL